MPANGRWDSRNLGFKGLIVTRHNFITLAKTIQPGDKVFYRYTFLVEARNGARGVAVG